MDPDALLSIVAATRKEVAWKRGVNLVGDASTPTQGRILPRVRWIIGFLVLVVVSVFGAVWWRCN
jgi:hypothetical protein